MAWARVASWHRYAVYGCHRSKVLLQEPMISSALKRVMRDAADSLKLPEDSVDLLPIPLFFPAS